MPLDHEVVDLTSSSPKARQAVENGGLTPSSEDYNCPICLELLLEPVVGACGHEFCKDCYSQWLSRSRTYPSCPLCRVPLSMTIPGVSRRLADLIEASFPEKMKHRREIQDKDKQAEAAQPPAAGNLHAHTHSLASAFNHSPWHQEEAPRMPSPLPPADAYFLRAHLLQPMQAAAGWGEGSAPLHRWPNTTPQGLSNLEQQLLQQAEADALQPARAAPTAAHVSSSDENFEAQLRQHFRAWDAQTPESVFRQMQTGADDDPSASDFSSSEDEDESDDDIEDGNVPYPSRPVPFTAEQAQAARAAAAWPHHSPPQSPRHDSQRPRPRYQRPDSPYPFQELAAAQQQHDTSMLSASPSPAQIPQSARPAGNSMYPLTHAVQSPYLQGAIGNLPRPLVYPTPIGLPHASAVPHAGNYMDFSGLLHSADRLAEASERLAVLAENQGQITEHIAGMRAGGAFPASSAYALHFSGYGNGGAPIYQPSISPTADPSSAATLSNFSASAPIIGSFAEGLPSPNILPFTMGAEPQAPSWGSRARRARRPVSASANPPRFRNRMQQRRAQGSQ